MSNNLILIELKDETERNTMFVRQNYDVSNADVDVLVYPTHWCLYTIDGALQEILHEGKTRIFNKKSFFQGAKDNNCKIDVFYVAKQYKMNSKWGTPNKFDFRDPITQVAIEVGACGEAEIIVNNPLQFFKQLAGPDKTYTIEKLQDFVRTRINADIVNIISNVLYSKQISYCEISQHLLEMNASILEAVNNMFEKDYGLQVTSFTIRTINISPEHKKMMEDVLLQKKQELKDKEKKEEEKKSAEEIAKELERLKDKEFDKQLILKKLELEDKAKYYEVLKIIGLNDKNKQYCSNCGNPITNDMMFCAHCGKPLKKTTINCPNCKKEVSSDALFCPNCGTKIK